MTDTQFSLLLWENNRLAMVINSDGYPTVIPTDQYISNVSSKVVSANILNMPIHVLNTHTMTLDQYKFDTVVNGWIKQ